MLGDMQVFKMNNLKICKDDIFPKNFQRWLAFISENGDVISNRLFKEVEDNIDNIYVVASQTDDYKMFCYYYVWLHGRLIGVFYSDDEAKECWEKYKDKEGYLVHKEKFEKLEALLDNLDVSLSDAKNDELISEFVLLNNEEVRLVNKIFEVAEIVDGTVIFSNEILDLLEKFYNMRKSNSLYIREHCRSHVIKFMEMQDAEDAFINLLKETKGSKPLTNYALVVTVLPMIWEKIIAIKQD